MPTDNQVSVGCLEEDPDLLVFSSFGLNTNPFCTQYMDFTTVVLKETVNK